MLKAGEALSVVYPQMTPFTCRTQAFHREAEVIRANYLKVDLLGSSAKRYSSKPRVELILVC